MQPLPTIPAGIYVQINIPVPPRKCFHGALYMAFLDCHVFCQGIADIDQQDSDNPQLCAEYAPFMYGYLRQLERQLAIKQDFLKVSF